MRADLRSTVCTTRTSLLSTSPFGHRNHRAGVHPYRGKRLLLPIVAACRGWGKACPKRIWALLGSKWVKSIFVCSLPSQGQAENRWKQGRTGSDHVRTAVFPRIHGPLPPAATLLCSENARPHFPSSVRQPVPFTAPNTFLPLKTQNPPDCFGTASDEPRREPFERRATEVPSRWTDPFERTASRSRR